MIGVVLLIAVSTLLWLGVPKMILERRYCDDYLRAYDSADTADTAEELVAAQKLANLTQPNFFGLIDGRDSPVTYTAVGFIRRVNGVAQAGTATAEDAADLGALAGDLADKCNA